MSLLISAGTKAVMDGSSDICRGELSQAAKKIAVGISSTMLACHLTSLEPYLTADFVKYTLCAGASSIAIKGAFQTLTGIRELNLKKVLKGSIQTAAGASASLFLYGLHSQTVLTANKIGLMLLFGGSVAKEGIKNIYHASYTTGIAQLLLGAFALIGTFYYAFNAFQASLIEVEIPPSPEMPPLQKEARTFLETHKEEVETLYTSNYYKIVGDWLPFGRGASKKFFIHPGLPNMGIKMPIDGNQDSILLNYENYKKVKEVANNLEKIKLPNIYLFNTSKGVASIEDLLKFIPFDEVNENSKNGIEQLRYLLYKTGLDDVSISRQHNVGFLNKEGDIGVIDFDQLYDPTHFIHNFSVGSFAIQHGFSIVNSIKRFIKKNYYEEFSFKDIKNFTLGFGSIMLIFSHIVLYHSTFISPHPFYEQFSIAIFFGMLATLSIRALRPLDQILEGVFTSICRPLTKLSLNISNRCKQNLFLDTQTQKITTFVSWLSNKNILS